MKLAVIYEGRALDWPSYRLLKGIKERGWEGKAIPVSLISARIGGKPTFRAGKKLLDDLDGAFLRAIGMVVTTDHLLRRLDVLEHMENDGITIMNPTKALRVARDKYLSLMTLDKAGIAVPKTVVTEDLVVAWEAIKEFKDCVIKPIIGSRGYGSIRVSDPDVAFRILRTLASFGQTLYIQEYVPKPDRDIRAFVVGEEVLVSMYRMAPPNEWRTNIAQGGRGDLCKLSSEDEKIAIGAVKALGLWYGGVDLIEGPEKLLVSEVNGSPDWRGLLEATNIDVTDRIISFITSKIKK